jgi:hypothetical protein
MKAKFFVSGAAEDFYFFFMRGGFNFVTVLSPGGIL